MYCRKCGEMLKDNCAFCEECRSGQNVSKQAGSFSLNKLNNKKLWIIAGAIIFIIIMIISVNAFATRALSANRIAKILPDEILGYYSDKMALNDIAIQKRQKDGKKDIVYTVIEMEDDKVHTTAYIKLTINYYNKAGWIIDDWQHQGATYFPLKPPSEDMVKGTLQRNYSEYEITLKSSFEDSLAEGRCIYTYEVESERPTLTYYGDIVVGCDFSESSGEWKASIDSEKIDYLKKHPTEDVIENALFKTYRDYTVTLKSLNMDSLQEGYCTYTYEVISKKTFLTFSGEVIVACNFSDSSLEWSSLIERETIHEEVNYENLIGEWEANWSDSNNTCHFSIKIEKANETTGIEASGSAARKWYYYGLFGNDSGYVYDEKFDSVFTNYSYAEGYYYDSHNRGSSLSYTTDVVRIYEIVSGERPQSGSTVLKTTDTYSIAISADYFFVNGEKLQKTSD